MQVSSRASFRRIAELIGTGEQTVARGATGACAATGCCA
ncbi:hypothetical protein [Mycobacterium tilburgii]